MHSNSVIDFGAHLHPRDVDIPDMLAQFDDIAGSRHRDPDAALEWFEAAGIDGAALSQPFFLGHDDANATAEANDVLLDTLNGYEQFFPMAALPVAAGGEAAAAEFERCLEMGYCGGALETKSNGIELHHEEVEPIYEVADEWGAPIFVHPKIMASLHPDALDETYRLNAIFGREVGLAESICKVIHEDVVTRYPNMNLVYHHMGGNIASMLGIINLQLDDGRWPDQDHVKPFSEFKSLLEERIYIDTSAYFGYHAPVRTALEELPSTQVLFGTDAPYHPRSSEEAADWRRTVEDVSSGTDSRQILGGNALDLLINAPD